MKKSKDKVRAMSKSRRYQFEATEPMSSALRAVVRMSADAGIKMSVSHIVRIAVAKYLVERGFMDGGAGFAELIGTVAENG